MKGFHAYVFVAVALVLTAACPMLLHAQQHESFVSNVEIADEVVTFQPDGPYVGFMMQVAGPGDFYLQQHFGGDQTPSLHLSPDAFVDGSYTVRLTAQPRIPEASRAALEEARARNDRAALARLQREAGLNGKAMVYSLNIGVLKGKFINPWQEETLGAGPQTGAATLPSEGASSVFGDDATASFKSVELTGRRWDATGQPGRFVAAPDVTGTAPLRSAFLAGEDEALPFQAGTPTSSWYEASFEHTGSDGMEKAYEGYLRPLIVNGEGMLLQAYVREANTSGTWVKGYFRSLGNGFRFIDLATVEAEAASREAPLFDYVTGEADALDGARRATVLTTNDGVVRSSLCVGIDCANAESFGFDTIRLKENNLRLHFDDTSNSGAFPSTDWRITANDSQNGGRSYLSVDDATNGRTPFLIEANAPTSALYVDDAGNIGVGTNVPAVETHMVDGDSPALRLQQDGSSGFQAQTWDVAGNETNFFVRDVTNGSQLPFKIIPGADNNALYVNSDNNIGMGTNSPQRNLHIVAGAPVQIRLDNTAANGEAWDFNSAANGDFRISDDEASPNVEFSLTPDGDLTILGTIVSGGGGTCDPGPCDGTFQPDFEVPTIEEHAAFMWENSHLWGVGPTPEGAPINLPKKTTGILHELEVAHIYIEQLHKRLEALEARLEALEAEKNKD